MTSLEQHDIVHALMRDEFECGEQAEFLAGLVLDAINDEDCWWQTPSLVDLVLLGLERYREEGSSWRIRYPQPAEDAKKVVKTTNEPAPREGQS